MYNQLLSLWKFESRPPQPCHLQEAPLVARSVKRWPQKLCPLALPEFLGNESQGRWKSLRFQTASKISHVSGDIHRIRVHLCGITTLYFHRIACQQDTQQVSITTANNALSNVVPCTVHEAKWISASSILNLCIWHISEWNRNFHNESKPCLRFPDTSATLAVYIRSSRRLGFEQIVDCFFIIVQQCLRSFQAYGLAWPGHIFLTCLFSTRLPSHLSKELIFRVAPFWAEVNPLSQMFPVRLQGYVGFPGGCWLSAPTLFQAHSRNFGPNRLLLPQHPLFSLQSESHVHTSM